MLRGHPMNKVSRPPLTGASLPATIGHHCYLRRTSSVGQNLLLLPALPPGRSTHGSRLLLDNGELQLQRGAWVPVQAERAVPSAGRSGCGILPVACLGT